MSAYRIKERWGAHLLPHVRLKVFITGHIDTNTPVLQPLGFNFVVLVRDGADHHVGDFEAFLEGEGGRRDHVVWVEAGCVGDY